MKFETLGILSDLHTEFEGWLYNYKKDVVYINAGDTATAQFKPSIREVVEKDVKEAGSEYFSVLGNHDFYAGSFPSPGENQKKLTTNNGIVIVGCTFWTKLSPVEFLTYKGMLADASYISGLTYDAYNDAHESDLQFLRDNPADIIVTHHSPSMRSCHPKWRGSHMDHFFHNNYDNVIADLKPILWIHGHTHDDADYKLDKTRVLCHPRGYPRETHFDDYEPKYLTVGKE